MFKKIILSIVVLLVLAIAGLSFMFYKDGHSNKNDVVIAENAIPKFTALEMNFTHLFNKEKSLPIVASAMIDVNNDGVEELYLGGGYDQQDQLMQYQNGKMVNIASQMGFEQKSSSTSIGAAVADFDDNGFQDLIISREDGLHLYYNSNGKFTHKAIETPVNDKSTPAGIALGDIDKDGDLDIFLATYLKKEKMTSETSFMDKSYGSTSELLLNEGGEKFVSITKSAGLDYVHNTFMGVWIDVDEDGDLDLVVAHDTGEVRTYKNNGNKTFALVENPTTHKYAYPMGIAVGDYNNNGLMDFAFSNTGSSMPRAIVKGDIADASLFNEKYILFKNKGNFNFDDAAKETKIADFEFSWGMIFDDMNNDGLQDLMVAENYVALLPFKFFKLPGRLLIQNENNEFGATEKASGVENRYYGITPLTSDFNQDGNLDLVWVNISGPSFAFLNNAKNTNFLQIDMPKTAKTIGAIVKLYLPSGKILTEHLVTGEGLASDNHGFLHFGLGAEKQASKLVIKYLDGTEKVIENPATNQKLKITI